MKPQHAGSNYKTLLPFLRKMRVKGQNIFKAGLGGSRLIFEDQGYNFHDYGHVYRLRYLKNEDYYFEVAIDDSHRTVTPIYYYDRNAISWDNAVPDLTEISCFWDWGTLCPRENNMRKADTLLWQWLDRLIHVEFYNAKYA